ncbi:MAG: ABC transporter ATP-binding protein [Chloroflexi bacterium]|nr:ABC transporter ATP-binding protein [Chloroflexota bacterium]
MSQGENGLAVETRGLVKKYGAFTAVDNLDLKIERGETYGLLGPNGSGKTTTIKVLCDLLKPTGGEAFLLGKKVGDNSIAPRIGYMPQETALYLDLSINDNICLFGEVYGMSRAEIASAEKELLEFVDLTKWRNTPVSNLSGGMRHRTSLACSMIHNPELLFMDEPTVGVDPELRASFWEYFETLGKRGATVVITTHYMDEAHRCGKIGVMRQGKLIAEGSPQDIIQSTGCGSLEDAFLELARKGGHHAD